MNDLEKRKEQLIEVLLQITDEIEDEETESIIRSLYSESIRVDENDLSVEGSALTEQERFVITLAISAQNFKINSEPFCSYQREDTLKLINLLNEMVINQLAQIVPGFDFELIDELSYAEYEKHKIKESVIAFSLFEPQYLVEFPENQQYPVDKLHMHGIRKTIEMLQKNQCLIIKKNDKGEKSKYKITGICIKDNVQNCVRVRLESSGKWTLLIPSNTNCGDTELIKSKHRRFVIKKSLDIRRLLTMYKISNEIKDGCVFDSIIKLIEALISQRKGAAVIYIDYCDCIENLIKHKRVFNILPIHIDSVLLKAFTSIDGAVIFNYQGQCIGYGAILDGEAVVDANLQRGSRYNSTRNFVELNRRSFGIIVSDDGMVDVVVNV